ncbi:YhbY family RNA-binding protein [Corticimicrobacter populi]|uniref:CRM domain-containing protein n=1 Tax=Corticimicrobacter populi TaxID=2175229 RepID=A0A2V1K1W3_9BURK|nr:YhbY family RNA-binding protein [Corticimicrobacter populi]PWF24106.1 hypothetical protein DD235_07310 [Corticimicrobacter populi]
MSILEITPRERSALRAEAHPLRPVVLIGDKGLSDPVLKEIDRNLNAHGLIKVRVSGADRADREVLLQTICESLSCAPVHHLGKTLILFRRAAAQPESVADLGVQPRQHNEAYVPKRQAAAGKSVAPKRAKPIKRTVSFTSARTAAGLPATKSTSRPTKAGTGFAKPAKAGSTTNSPRGAARPARSALSLKAGARSSGGIRRTTLARSGKKG